jgi:hypothetical protein
MESEANLSLLIYCLGLGFLELSFTSLILLHCVVVMHRFIFIFTCTYFAVILMEAVTMLRSRGFDGLYFFSHKGKVKLFLCLIN